MSIKISLGVNELERLLGGNEEVLIELRQAAASEFSKRYLRDFANSETMKQTLELTRQAIVAGIRDEINKQIGEVIGSKRWDEKSVFKPTPKFQDVLQDYIRNETKKEIESITQQYIDNWKAFEASYLERFNERMERSIEKKMDASIEQRIQEGINERLQKAMKQ